MKTRPVISVVLFALLISTALASTAHVLASPAAPQHSSLNDLTVPSATAGSYAISPSSPSTNPCSSSSWTPVLHEDFDSVTPPTLPASWVSIPVTGTESLWETHAGTYHPAGGVVPSPPNLVYFDSWRALPGESARLYRMITLDLRRYTKVYLCAMYYRDPGYSNKDDRVQPQVSTNSGLVWMDVGNPLHRYSATAGWWTAASDITSIAAGQPAVLVGFLGISEFGNDVHLDNIQILAVPNLFLPLLKR